MSQESFYIDTAVRQAHANHGRLHAADKEAARILVAAMNCGLMRQAGNGWYQLTNAGHEWALQLEADERRFEDADQ